MSNIIRTGCPPLRCPVPDIHCSDLLVELLGPYDTTAGTTSGKSTFHCPAEHTPHGLPCAPTISRLTVK